MNETKLEHRYAELAEVEGRTLAGLALPFETEARIGSMRERFARGSVTSSGEAILNRQHQRAVPLAREPETLSFEVTESGLLMRAVLPETREADDVLALVKARVLRGLSVEFVARQERLDGGVRVIERAEIRGLAVVDSGAYQTGLSVREHDISGVGEPVPWWMF